MARAPATGAGGPAAARVGDPGRRGRPRLGVVRTRRRLRDAERHACARLLRTETFAPEAGVIRQGDPGDHLYIVHSGAFAAFVADAASGQEAKVADYKSGQYFGELALLYNSPRAATVRAQETGTCYCLDRATFRTLVKGYLTK